MPINKTVLFTFEIVRVTKTFCYIVDDVLKGLDLHIALFQDPKTLLLEYNALTIDKILASTMYLFVPKSVPSRFDVFVVDARNLTK